MFLTICLSGFFLLTTGCGDDTVEEPPVVNLQLQTKEVQVKSPDDIVTLTDSLVAPLLYSNIKGLDSLPLPQKKLKFISALLPAILVAKDKLYRDKQTFEEMVIRKDWTERDSLFFHKLSLRYRSRDTSAILSALETHPNSIVLAQAAVESGWGNSRIFGVANNLFGIWSYNSNESRIPASIKRNGETIYLRKYDNVSESISDYFSTIGRSRFYADFREARERTDEVEDLIPYLINYSERKEAYVEQLRTMIRFNGLKEYDSYILDPAYYVDPELAEQ
jgi:Bax protein